MVFAELDRRRLRDSSIRVHLFVQILTNAGYASFGIAFADPLLRTGDFGATNVLSFVVGLVGLTVAVYLAPQGERHERL